MTVAGTTGWDGRLDVTGSFTQTPSGFLRLFIAGDVQGETYSFLNVGEAASLDGTIQIVLEPSLFGFSPSVGQSFDVIHADGGITVVPSGVAIHTLMTAAGAAELGISLPKYLSPFAADPNHLVTIDPGLFTYSLVDDGTTLRVTLNSPVCAPMAGPESVSVCRNTEAIFGVTARGSGPFTFVWRRDGVPIDLLTNPTAHSASLVIASATQADEGSYDCVVANECATVTSNAATSPVNTVSNPLSLRRRALRFDAGLLTRI